MIKQKKNNPFLMLDDFFSGKEGVVSKKGEVHLKKKECML